MSMNYEEMLDLVEGMQNRLREAWAAAEEVVTNAANLSDDLSDLCDALECKQEEAAKSLPMDAPPAGGWDDFDDEEDDFAGPTNSTNSTVQPAAGNSTSYGNSTSRPAPVPFGAAPTGGWVAQFLVRQPLNRRSE